MLRSCARAEKAPQGAPLAQERANTRDGSPGGDDRARAFQARHTRTQVGCRPNGRHARDLTPALGDRHRSSALDAAQELAQFGFGLIDRLCACRGSGSMGNLVILVNSVGSPAEAIRFALRRFDQRTLELHRHTREAVHVAHMHALETCLVDRVLRDALV